MIHQFTALLVFLSLASISTTEFVACDFTLYDNPNVNDCKDILFDNRAAQTKGIESIDAKDHGFYVWQFNEHGRPRNLTPTQWRNKVYLAQYWTKGGCSMLLSPAFVDRGQQRRVPWTDSGHYYHIAGQAEEIITACDSTYSVAGNMPGGRIRVGDNDKLVAFFFRPGSLFDAVVQYGLDPQHDLWRTEDLEEITNERAREFIDPRILTTTSTGLVAAS